MIEDNSSSTVHMTNENIEEIYNIVVELRNKLLG